MESLGPLGFGVLLRRYRLEAEITQRSLPNVRTLALRQSARWSAEHADDRNGRRSTCSQRRSAFHPVNRARS